MFISASRHSKGYATALALSLVLALVSLPFGSQHSFSQPTPQLAQRSPTRVIRFKPGSNSAIVQNSVVRGDRDIYLLDAKKGQVMQVKITSLENNAVFDIATPVNPATQTRRVLKAGVVGWSGTLPQSGEYQVIVGGTRGNATYRLQVVIR
jgi:hypothetical protein